MAPSFQLRLGVPLLLRRSDCPGAAFRCPTSSAGRTSGRERQPLAFARVRIQTQRLYAFLTRVPVGLGCSLIGLHRVVVRPQVLLGRCSEVAFRAHVGGATLGRAVETNLADEPCIAHGLEAPAAAIDAQIVAESGDVAIGSCSSTRRRWGTRC